MQDCVSALCTIGDGMPALQTCCRDLAPTCARVQGMARQRLAHMRARNAFPSFPRCKNPRPTLQRVRPTNHPLKRRCGIATAVQGAGRHRSVHADAAGPRWRSAPASAARAPNSSHSVTPSITAQARATRSASAPPPRLHGSSASACAALTPPLTKAEPPFGGESGVSAAVESLSHVLQQPSAPERAPENSSDAVPRLAGVCYANSVTMSA